MSEMDFDAFLSEAASEHDAEKSRNRLEVAVMLAIDVALDECGVKTAFRFDGEARSTQEMLADSDVRQRIHDDAAQMRRLHATICVLRAGDGELTPSFHKKVMMAELFAYSGCDEDSSWILLADKLIPDAEGIDFNSTEDAVFIGQALSTMVARERNKQLFNDIVMTRIQTLIANADDDIVETDHYLRILGGCSALYDLSPGLQEAALDELVRETGLPRSEVEQMRDAYAVYYDTTGSYFPVGLL